MRICPKCKTEYPDDKKFCKNCRAQLVSIEESSQKNSVNITSRNTVFKEDLKPDPTNLAEKGKYSETFNNATNNKKKYIITISSIAICVIAGIILINFITFQKEKNVSITSKPELSSDNSENISSSSASVMTSLMEWHNSLGSFDYDNYIKYYAQSVKYFNKVVDLNYIIKEKSLFFKSGAWQKISNDISNIRIESINDNNKITYFNYDCEFLKNTGRVFSVNVDKMIVWSKIDGFWKITEERDVKLNNNRSHK